MSLQAVTTGGAFSRNTCFQPGAGAHEGLPDRDPVVKGKAAKYILLKLQLCLIESFQLRPVRWLSP